MQIKLTGMFYLFPLHEQHSGGKPSMRKSSYGGAGDYDSELVDGRYLTTVPIISVTASSGNANDDGNADDGNIRPLHRPSPRGLKDLKKPREDSVVDRWGHTFFQSIYTYFTGLFHLPGNGNSNIGQFPGNSLDSRPLFSVKTGKMAKNN